MKRYFFLFAICLLLISCSKDDKDENVDYLKGGEKTIKEGIVGTWKTTIYDNEKTYVVYLEFNETVQWSWLGDEKKPSEPGSVYRITTIDNNFCIVYPAGSVKWIVKGLTNTTFTFMFSDDLNTTRNYTRIK